LPLISKINKYGPGCRVLVAPLDWGLGHATRCIPIIQHLLHAGCEVLIAAEGAVAALLQKEFPQCRQLPLAGYGIRYSKTKTGFAFAMLRQVPKLLQCIRSEHDWLQKTVQEEQINLVIADNRYGLWHPRIPCIFLTHQLQIQLPQLRSAQKLLQKINYKYISRFTQCWVPDAPMAPSLAGELSHPKKLPANLRYIGPLSRFTKIPGIKKQYELLVLLSGPEPQRSIFENLLLQQIGSTDKKILLVRGLPNAAQAPDVARLAHLTIKNHLPATELSAAIQSAAYVLARTGYTTVMDLVQLQQAAILVPTPGQTEQEYLAAHLRAQGLFYTTSQTDFDLGKSLAAAAAFYAKQVQWPLLLPGYAEAVDEVLGMVEVGG
jgi:uncharacterized protein (TIGR00661 family)